MRENCALDLTESKLISHLEDIGFPRPSINQAFDWLENLSALGKAIKLQTPSSTRVYSAEEKKLLNEECIGFMLFLEQQGILNTLTRELVINQVLELKPEDDIDISLIKWVALMVLFNQPEEKGALACMEFLVLDDSTGSIH